MGFLKKEIIIYWRYLLLVIIVCLAYLPTFTGDFIIDDNLLIKENPYVRELHSISSYLLQEDGIVDEKDLGDYHTGYYRPLINLTYWLDYKLWGMEAPGFRVTNLALHLVICFILYRLVALIVKDNRAAFWITFLFALHPVNTESVSWIISRNNILVTLFILISLYSYIKLWENDHYIAGVASLICFTCALFSKEFGVMTLPVFFLFHRFLSKKKKIILELVYYVPFIIILVLYFILRQRVIGSFVTPFDSSLLVHSLYFVPYLILWNVKLIFIPYGLHYFYLIYPDAFIDFRAIFSIVLTISLVIILFIKRDIKLLLFSVASFLVFLFPVLNIIPSASSIVTLVAMRWLYLPMSFLCFGLAWGIHKADLKYKRLVTAIMIIVLAYFSIYTFILNRTLWHDEKTLYQQEVKGFNNVSLAGDYAELLFEDGNLVEAEKYFKIALDNNFQRAYYYINYSSLLIKTGRPEAAMKYLQQASLLSMTHHERGQWYNNWGTALWKLGDLDQALNAFEKSVQYAPSEVHFLSNLGSIYAIRGDYDKAVATFQRAISVSPDSISLWMNLARCYIDKKEYKSAVLVLEKLPEAKKDKKVLRLLKIAREKSDTKQNGN